MSTLRQACQMELGVELSRAFGGSREMNGSRPLNAEKHRSGHLNFKAVR